MLSKSSLHQKISGDYFGGTGLLSKYGARKTLTDDLTQLQFRRRRHNSGTAAAKAALSITLEVCMSIKFLGSSALLRVLTATVFLTAIPSGLLHAQTPGKEAKALTTLDVCENPLTGQWVYSGVVTLPGEISAGTAVKVDYMVQNRVNSDGYRTSYRGTTHALVGGGSLVHGFSVEAPALTLGTMRGAAKVHLADPASPGQFSTFEVMTSETVCGCTPVRGCVRSQGYWGNKPKIAWPAPYSRDAFFFASGMTLQQILDAPVKGSGYLILAKQYLATVLNYAAGASAPPSVINAINQASTFLSSGTTPASCGPGQCQEQKALAAILDTYNNGVYPGGPGHCPN